MHELIDTLWNVNTGGRNQRVAGEEELIDTLWNVNSVFPRISPTTNPN